MAVLYYTSKARESHIKNIERLCGVLAHIPVKHFEDERDGYTNVKEIINYLSEYKELIQREHKECQREFEKLRQQQSIQPIPMGAALYH